MQDMDTLMRAAAYLGLIVAAAVGFHPPPAPVTDDVEVTPPASSSDSVHEPQLVRHRADLSALLPRESVVVSGVYEGGEHGLLVLVDGTAIRVPKSLGLGVGQPVVLSGALSWVPAIQNVRAVKASVPLPKLGMALPQLADTSRLRREPVRDLRGINARLGRAQGRFEGVLGQRDDGFMVTLADGSELSVVAPVYLTPEGLVSPLISSLDRVVVLHGELALRSNGSLAVRMDHLRVCDRDCALVYPGW